jgi:II/X family phage/plasmid replication protein
MMVDWFTGVLPCDHDHTKLSAGLVASISATGDIEWTVQKALSVEGSHSSTIQIKSLTDKTIEISGNPAKWLQGHNIFGSDDLVYLVNKFFTELLLRKGVELGLSPNQFQLERIRLGAYQVSRVDINESWLLDGRSSVLAWLRAAGGCARLKRRGVGQYSGETLYFGKSSRRWAVKCYSKGHEINAKGHKLPKELQIPELLDFADKALRIELVIRSMGLKYLNLTTAKDWSKDTPKMLLFKLVLDDLEMSDNMPLPDEVLKSIQPRLRHIYVLWKDGEDLRQTYSKAQFYRYRKAMLQYGIDISILQEKEKSNVIPLIRYLEAVPAQIPQWAYDKDLVA